MRHPLLVLAPVIALLAPTPVALGQGASPPSEATARALPPLTLAEALRLSLENSPRLRLAAGDRLVRVGQAAERSALPNPHFEWRREGTGTAAGVDDFINIALPLDITGRRFVARGAVAATRRSAVADSVAVARAVAFDAARAYHRASLAVALAASASRQQEALEGVARYDSTRWREGAAAELVALRAGLEAGRSRAATARARMEVDRLHSDLAVVLGLPADSLGEPLPLTLERTEPSAFPPLPALEELGTRALAARPEVQAASEAVRAAELAVRVERLGALGDVTVGGGTRRSGGETGGTVSVGMYVPLLDRNGPARQRANGELIRARAEQRRVELAILADVARAAAEYERLRHGLAADVAGDGARGAEVAGILQAAYREGGATLLELLDAQRAAAETDAAVLRWLADLELARLDLLQALGAPYPDAE